MINERENMRAFEKAVESVGFTVTRVYCKVRGIILKVNRNRARA